jgi:hypothetical protein
MIGVGVLSGNSQADMSDAIQMTTFVLRYFAHMAGQQPNEIDLARQLQQARRMTRPVDARYTLQLAVLPASEMLQLPADHLGLLTVTTRHWKRGRARVTAAVDALTAEFLCRSRRSPDQVRIEGIPHTRARRYFAYQVFIRWTELQILQLATH